MTEKQRKIEKYLENSRTESGYIDLNHYNEDSQLEGFLETFDCEFEIEVLQDEACPSCLSLSLIKEGRCTTCLDCGYSLCSL